MAEHTVAHPSIFADINRLEARYSTSAQVVGAYHVTAEKAVGFLLKQEQMLEATEKSSALGRIIAKSSLVIPKIRAFESVREATQLAVYHLYDQRIGTFIVVY